MSGDCFAALRPYLGRGIYPDGELLNRLPLTASPRTRPQVEGQQFLSPLSLCQRRVPGFPSFAQQPPAPATDPTLATHNLTKLKERTPLRIQPEFPDYRYQDPKRQAELRVYQKIASSQIPGQALYEVNTTRHTPQVDIVVWVEGVACFAISVKGGTYSVDNGTIFLHTPEGPILAKNTLQQALDGALSVRNALNSHLKRAFFVIAVLLLPDMEPDREIERWANTSRTNVMFGTHNLVERHQALDDVQAVRFPPSAEQIDEEVAFIKAGPRPADNQVPVPGDGAWPSPPSRW